MYTRALAPGTDIPFDGCLIFLFQCTQRPPPQHYPPPGSTAKRKGRARKQGDRNGHAFSNDYRSRDRGFVLAPKSHQKGGNLFDVMPVGVMRLKKSEKKVGVAILKTLTPGTPRETREENIASPARVTDGIFPNVASTFWKKR